MSSTANQAPGATFYAEPAGLAVCLRNAGIGQSFVYAKGPALDPAHAVVRLVKAEVEAGRATTHLRGRDGEGALQYLVKVTQRARAVAPAMIEPVAARVHPDAEAIYDLLVAAAQAKRPCPSNDALAELTGLSDRYKARHRFDQLVRAGLITVIEPARYGTRVVEICAGGQRTAPSGARETRTKATSGGK